jgi:hypothetical protein
MDRIDGLEVGLEAARLNSRLYPDFFVEHLIDRTITPGGLVDAVGLLLELTNQQLPMDWPADLEGPLGAPEQWLNHTPNPLDMSLLGTTLPELRYWIESPRPVLHGLGVTTVLDEGVGEMNLLMIAVWHLCSGLANWRGVDMRAISGELHGVDAEIIERLFSMHIVRWDRPGLFPSATFFKNIDIPGLRTKTPHGLLVAYALGDTGNEFADMTNYEVDAVYGGDEMFDWSGLPDMIDQSLEARAMKADFVRWSQQMQQHPDRELTRLGKALRRAMKMTMDEIEDDPDATLLGALGPELDEPLDADLLLEAL